MPAPCYITMQHTLSCQLSFCLSYISHGLESSLLGMDCRKSDKYLSFVSRIILRSCFTSFLKLTKAIWHHSLICKGTHFVWSCLTSQLCFAFFLSTPQPWMMLTLDAHFASAVQCKNALDIHFNALYVCSANFNGSCFVLLDGARIVLELPLQD